MNLLLFSVIEPVSKLTEYVRSDCEVVCTNESIINFAKQVACGHSGSLTVAIKLPFEISIFHRWVSKKGGYFFYISIRSAASGAQIQSTEKLSSLKDLIDTFIASGIIDEYRNVSYVPPIK